MKFWNRIKPKTKSGFVNYIIALLVLVQQVLTFTKNLAFVALDKFTGEYVNVHTSMQQYIWFPNSGNNKLNLELGKQLKENFEPMLEELGELTGGPHAVSNHAVMFPVIMLVAAIALLIVCVWHGGGKATTALSVIYSVAGLVACFVPFYNFLFNMQQNYLVQMVLIIVVAALSVLSIVFRIIERDKKQKAQA